jgi:hypothetical protein
MKGPAPLHEIMMVLRGATPNHLHLRQRLSYLVLGTVVVDLVCSWLAYGLERDAPRSQLHTYGQCLFWTTTQLLTVSSQLVNPVTGNGMWLDVGMEFVGITVVAALAGSLGSFLYRRSLEMSPLHPKLNDFLEKFEHSELLDRLEGRERLREQVAGGAGAQSGSSARLPDTGGEPAGGQVSGSATPSG